MNLKTYIIILALLAFGVSAYGQGDRRIDAALDRYEVICDRCILLREKSSRGEKIQPEELKSLLEQVTELRTTLQNGSRNMSPSQKERFERIRRRYTVAFSGQAPPKDGPALKVARPVLDLPRVESGEKILRYAFGYAQNDKGLCQDKGLFLDKRLYLDGPSCHPEGAQRPKDLSPSLIVLGGWRHQSLSYGAMATITGQKFGLYLKGRSNFLAQKAEYSCLSDGTSDGRVIWTSGRESHAEWSLGAGGMFKITGLVSLYVGSGYGLSETLWEDASGKWARVEDLSAKGICADAGIIFTISHFQASAGVSTVSLKNPTLEIGLGITF